MMEAESLNVFRHSKIDSWYARGGLVTGGYGNMELRLQSDEQQTY